MTTAESSGVRRFGFVGVTASSSSINRVFPRWAEILGLGDVELVPIDLPVDVDDAAYHDVVSRIADEPGFAGALVTTHKVRLFHATRDRFVAVDEHARHLGEVSCIAKRPDGLHGAAMDPITSGAAMDAFLPRRHFADTGGHVLCLGAGGAGLAIAVSLLGRDDPAQRPGRITLVDRDPARLGECERILGTTEVVRLEQSAEASRNDELLAEQPPGSLIVNATGMGKDRPGSPITDDAVFPVGGYAWELNYRGERDFLRQALAARDDRDLVVEDGWSYFVNGWATVVAEVFDLRLDDELLQRLSDAAAEVRG